MKKFSYLGIKHKETSIVLDCESAQTTIQVNIEVE